MAWREPVQENDVDAGIRIMASPESLTAASSRRSEPNVATPRLVVAAIKPVRAVDER
jgi:hypothetical protein